MHKFKYGVSKCFSKSTINTLILGTFSFAIFCQSSLIYNAQLLPVSDLAKVFYYFFLKINI